MKSSNLTERFSDFKKMRYLVLFLALMYIIFLNPHLDVKGFNMHDPTEYLNRAMSICNGTGYGVAFADQFFSVTIHTPGFSLLLAPIVGLFGINFLALKLYMVLIAALFALALYRFFLYFLTSNGKALVSTLLVMSSPVIFGLSHRVMSDISLYLFGVLALVSLDSYLKRSVSVISFSLFMAAILMVLAYSFKMTALGIIAGGWLLGVHSAYRKRETFAKLFFYTSLCFIPILLWQHWTTTVPDQWYWSHSPSEFFLKEPFKPDGSATTLGEFLVRMRRNWIYGMAANLLGILIPLFHFVDGHLLTFFITLPLLFWLGFHFVRSYLKNPSVLEGFVLSNLALMLLKYHGFAARYMAFLFPAVVVYTSRSIEFVPKKIRTYAVTIALSLSILCTLIAAFDQWRDPYGSEIMRDYVAIAQKAKETLHKSDRCLAPIGSHWQVLTQHQCFYEKKNFISAMHTSDSGLYIVALNYNFTEDVDKIWNEGHIRHIDHDALKDGMHFRELIQKQPLSFEKLFENRTFALHKVK